MNKKSIWLASAALVAGAVAVAYARRKNYAPLPVAPNIDLKKYMGEWYEIARFPEPFERGCHATKAHYTLCPDGSVDILNTCRKGSVDGEMKTASGKAYQPDPNESAKLEVQFFWPFKGDYWILDVDTEYQYALVGEPSRDSLWILSRTPSVELGALQELTAKAQELGFDTDRLMYTQHKK
jgi:apolipoprotein D and lipocalin family protein